MDHMVRIIAATLLILWYQLSVPVNFLVNVTEYLTEAT